MPITPLLHESVARFAATGADITTRAEPDLFVSIDPDHLRRILTAVLDNAITHGDGEIAVTAHARDGAVDIGVRDHGPGFADHFLPVAFDRFTRADTARGGRGSGLGLAIVAPSPPPTADMPTPPTTPTAGPNSASPSPHRGRPSTRSFRGSRHQIQRTRIGSTTLATNSRHAAPQLTVWSSGSW